MKVRHYVIKRNNRAYWMPTPAMKRQGFSCVSLGPAGPAAIALAEQLNAQWDDARRGIAPPGKRPVPKAEKVYPAGSLGEAFQRYRRTNEWALKAPRTREDWERGWRYIAPVFADHSPELVTLEIVSDWRMKVQSDKGVREAHRAMKIWRALWKVAAAMKYCKAPDDPSLAVRNKEASGRKEIYSEGEVVRLVKAGVRSGYRGYACIVALMWDGALPPIDGRTITAGQMHKDAKGTWFRYSRGKTGRDGVIALSRRTERLLRWYLDEIYNGLDIAPGVTLFRTRRGARLHQELACRGSS